MIILKMPFHSLIVLLPWFHSPMRQQSTEYCGVDRVLLVHVLSTLPRSPPSFHLHVPSLLTFTAVLPNPPPVFFNEVLLLTLRGLVSPGASFLSEQGFHLQRKQPGQSEFPLHPPTTTLFSVDIFSACLSLLLISVVFLITRPGESTRAD